MTKNILEPDFIFESSWEVCNKVGGIYTVLSTRAKTLQDKMKDAIVFIGPDCWKETESPYFREDCTLLSDWKIKALSEGLNVRIGRWNVPGNPIAVLVDIESFYQEKNLIYAHLWEDFQVDSLHAYGDYDEASMFSYAAGRVVESYYRYYLDSSKKVVYHGNEWMAGLGLLYIQAHVPEIATLFTTHATSIGRSIAGNNKPLYQYLSAYNGDQMAYELNMQSKHSIEKQTAKYVDCFTTVSDITATECAKLLDKSVDEVLLNGFEDAIVPQGADFTKKRTHARKKILQVANALMGESFDNDTLIVSTSGRYEFRNKGIDVFIEAVNGLRFVVNCSKKVLAIIAVPAWSREARTDLIDRIQQNRIFDSPLEYPMLTHWLHNFSEDRVVNMMNNLGMYNQIAENVKLMFVPCYLIGDDGIFNLPYYDLLLGNDLCIYPSYYEPWGYTPLEAIAFKVPCLTTDLAGFGLWANSIKGGYSELEDGVKVVHRNDDNYFEVANVIKETIVALANKSKSEVQSVRNKAFALSKKALWSKFITYYEQAYHKALTNAANRNLIK